MPCTDDLSGTPSRAKRRTACPCQAQRGLISEICQARDPLTQGHFLAPVSPHDVSTISSPASAPQGAPPIEPSCLSPTSNLHSHPLAHQPNLCVYVILLLCAPCPRGRSPS
jgi:hypothetical protein